MPRIILLLFFVYVPAIVVADNHDGAAVRAVNHEDVWTMRRLGTPVPSPDGKWVVVKVTEPAYDEEENVSDLWLIAVDGDREPRRLTASSDSEDGVAWSPDSTRIAFSSKRGEEDVARSMSWT